MECCQAMSASSQFCRLQYGLAAIRFWSARAVRRLGRKASGKKRISAASRFGSVLEIARRRIIARVDRISEELLGIVSPELAHVRISLDDRVNETTFLTDHFPDVHVTDDVAVAVERHRPAAGVHFDVPQCLHKSVLV